MFTFGPKSLHFWPKRTDFLVQKWSPEDLVYSRISKQVFDTPLGIIDSRHCPVAPADVLGGEVDPRSSRGVRDSGHLQVINGTKEALGIPQKDVSCTRH